MSKSDTAFLKLTDIPTAIGLLSRLPVSSGGTRGAAAAWAFPLVGLIIGLLAAITGWVLTALGLSANLTAAFVLLTMIITTGAMHEDGLADTVDGLWGGWEPTRRLEIMKDSHIGTYGVIALILSLLIRWGTLSALINADMLAIGVISVATLSRAPMVVMMALMPHARTDGLSASVGRVAAKTAQIAALIAIIVTLALLGWAAITAIAITTLAALITALIAQQKIGGQTGDILGATQQISEIAALTALTIALI